MSQEVIQEQTLSRFLSKTKVIPETGCWEWQRCIQKSGYGGFRFELKWARTHRVSWILHKGLIPEGLCVLHKCDNRKCVNPEHLFLGTYKNNEDDKIVKGREKARVKLTRAQVIEIRQRLEAGETTIALEKDYSVCQAHLSDIKNRKYWKYI